MRGREVFYPMGWDDNGLNVERRVQILTGTRVRPVAAVRPRLPAAREGVEEGQADPGQPAQLRRAVRQGGRAARGELLRPVVEPRPVGRLDPDLPHDRPRGDPGQPARLRPAGRARPGLPVRGAHAVGRRLPLGRRPGRAAGPRDPRRLPQDPLRRARRPGDLDRHHPPRAAAGLRRPRRPPRRRALPAAVREVGAHPAVRRRGADRRPRAGRARQGHRHRHDLHLRRHDRRHLVARARPRPAGRGPARRAPALGRLGRAGVGVRRPRRGAGGLRRARRAHRQAGPGPHRRAAHRGRA